MSGGRRKGKGTRGQVWSLDYTFGMLLFIFSFLVVAGVLARTLLLGDSFPDLLVSAETMGDRVMGTGYPVYWRSSDVVAAGLLTDDRLSLRKAEAFAAIAEDDYGLSKRLLGIRHDYALSFEEADGSIVSIGNVCAIGNASQQRTLSDERLPVGYYAASYPSSARLDPAMWNASVFDGNGLDELLANASAYRFIVLEHPRLGDVATPYDAEKATLLEEYVRLGGTLLLIGDVNLTEAFSLNVSLINTSVGNLTGAFDEGLLNLSGKGVDDIPEDDFALMAASQDGYESILPLGDGRDFAARFAYGDGDVYYVGGVNGTMNGTGETFAAYLTLRLNVSSMAEVANCTSVAPRYDGAKHRIAVERLVASGGRILLLRMAVWE